MRTDPTRQERIEDVFHRVAEAPEGERVHLLATLCKGDAELEREVTELLRCLKQAPTHLDAPPVRLPVLQARIGGFEIVRLLGEGGMGQVFEAKQAFPSRRVALKVIRAGMAGEGVLKRFEFEASALGRLKHPGIAQIYEAGFFDGDGLGALGGKRPYFAMELVDGRRLDEAIARRPVREILELLARIADAVHHAHQNGIVHRDLKPGNILLDTSGPFLQPKVLDFGVARFAPEAAGADSMHTDGGQMIGTVAYMSPEQLEGKPADTQSDVYALGVVAYQLLSGRLPHATTGSSLYEATRTILENDPEPIERLKPELRGDVATMIAKAMAKEPSRRYTSAVAFAEDLRHYLADEPVTARPATTAYVLGKFAKRRKGAVFAAGAVTAALVIGAVGIVWNAKIAREERDHAVAARQAADKSRARVQAVNDFVRGALASSDPAAGGKQDATVVQAMENAVKQLDGGHFKDQPDLDAYMRGIIASVLSNNGKGQRAEALYAQALATYEDPTLPPHPDDLIGTLISLGGVQSELGKGADAEKTLGRAIDVLEKTAPGDSERAVHAMINLGLVKDSLGKSDEAATLLGKALDMSGRVYPKETVEMASVAAGLAGIEQRLGKYDRADELYSRSLKIVRELYNGDHPLVARAMNNLATLRFAIGKYEEALDPFQESLDMRRRMFKGDHPEVARAISNVAMVKDRVGRVDDAEKDAREALAMWQRLFAKDHPSVALAFNNVGVVVLHAGRANEAVTPLSNAIEMDRRLYLGDHADTAQTLNQLAQARAAAGDTAHARKDFDDSIAMMRRLTPNGSAMLAQALYRSAQARPPAESDAARTEYQEAVTLGERFLPPRHPLLMSYKSSLANAQKTAGG